MLSRVKIGPMVYRIEVVDGLHDRGEHLFGDVNHGECVIRLEGRHSSQQTVQTLLHEIVHTLLLQSGRPRQEGDEGLVDSLAYGLMAVFQDNPALSNLLKSVDN